MIYKNFKHKIDGITFETETINSDYKIFSIYTYWHPLSCFWLTNNQSEYLRRKNESWEYILNTVK